MLDESKPWNYGILGTGALGGYYGGLLARSGLNVHFLARSDHQHIAANGLKVDSVAGNFVVRQPNVYGSTAEMPKVDVAVVTWKATANRSLRTALNHVCHPESLVLVLQNGLHVEKDAIEVVGRDRVLGGCCFLCSNKVGPGHINHVDYGGIAIGETSLDRRGTISSRMEKLQTDFVHAGIDLQLSPDLLSVRWKKLAWNIPFNGLSVVLSADTSEIMNDPDSRSLAEELMRDVQRGAHADNASFDDEHIAKMLIDTEKMVPYDSSMRIDYMAKRPIEVEAIFGNPLRTANAAGIEMPSVETLYRQLCFLDRRNRLGRVAGQE